MKQKTKTIKSTKPKTDDGEKSNTQIANVMNEKGDITDTTYIKRREFYEEISANKLNNSDEVDKFLERHQLSRLTQEEIDN